MEEDHLFIKRITEPGDPDFAGFVRQFSKNKSMGYRFHLHKIITWVTATYLNRNIGDWESYLYLLKYFQKVVGFIYFEYYKRREYVFIGWLEITDDAKEGRQKGVDMFKNTLLDTLRAELTDCTAIIAEYNKAVEASYLFNNQKLPPLKSFLRSFAEGEGLNIYKLNMDYFQPIQEPNPQVVYEKPIDLLYIPLKPKSVLKSLPKKHVERLVRFMYLDVYPDEMEADIIIKMDEEAHMNALYHKCVRSLPDEVELVVWCEEN